jgi:hypothetical protein
LLGQTGDSGGDQKDLLGAEKKIEQIEGEINKNLALEAEGKYAAAIAGWSSLARSTARFAGEDPNLKKLYFEVFFYGTRALFKYAMHDPTVKNKDKIIAAAAKRIVDLEFAKSRDGWEIAGNRFQKLLESEPDLREAYERCKKDR